MRTNAVRPWPDVAIPPGETHAETLETLGMSQAELARRMDRPVQAVNEIIRGSKEITAETAIQLERVLGIPVHVWVRLDVDRILRGARPPDLPVEQPSRVELVVSLGAAQARGVTIPLSVRTRADDIIQ